MSYAFRSKVLVYPGVAAWRFLHVPVKDSEKLRKKYGVNARGWGSLPVDVKIGKTSWQTSVFPDKRSGCYLLPLKAAVRKAEQIDDEDTVRFSIVVRV
jgi:hypothetical protein